MIVISCPVCGSNKTQNAGPKFYVCDRGHKFPNVEAKEKEERRRQDLQHRRDARLNGVCGMR